MDSTEFLKNITDLFQMNAAELKSRFPSDLDDPKTLLGLFALPYKTFENLFLETDAGFDEELERIGQIRERLTPAQTHLISETVKQKLFIAHPSVPRHLLSNFVANYTSEMPPTSSNEHSRFPKFS